ncbi:zinc finger BED domain-containing protein RICESLEEPER 2-like protein, partial [Tanacetum coccineum]
EVGNEDELVVDVDELVIDVDEPVINVNEPVINVDVDDTEVHNRKSFVWDHFTYVKESEEDMFESDDDDLSKRGQVVRRVKSTLTELYKHYKMKADKEKHQNTPVASSSTPTCGASRLKVDIESGFGKYMEKREGIKSTEVEIYLRDGTERRDEKFDVLGWWKQNSEKFPILSQVARHVLAMPVSTVSSESAFSTGGRVIDKFRRGKRHELFMCTRDEFLDIRWMHVFVNLVKLT